MHVVLPILLILVLSLITAYEMAIFSTRQEHMRNASRSGDRRGTLVMAFLRSPTKIISALQLLATGLNLAIGLELTQFVNDPFDAYLRSQGIAIPMADAIAYWSTLIGGTTVLLIASNLIPKRIAYAHADPISLKYAKAATVTARILAPFSNLFSSASEGILKLCGVKLPSAPAVTEADVVLLLAQGHLRGTIDPHERKIIESAFQLSELNVRDIMSPRSRVRFLRPSDPRDRQIATALEARHSVLPVGETLDEAVSAVRVVDLIAEQGRRIEDLAVPILRIPPTASAIGALEAFRACDARMAMVVDEHSKALGVLTFNDLVRAMLGRVKAME